MNLRETYHHFHYCPLCKEPFDCYHDDCTKEEETICQKCERQLEEDESEKTDYR